ncbi:MAG: hypothetical protein JOZ69_10800, partial [Myxococcales bacterium]|nr:hypothetical protein [Myxococcales bacterium]
PLHTPPPESGRLPAAPEFDRDVTGVRSSAPLAGRREPVESAAPPPARELVPEITAAAVAPSEAVADWVAEAQRFAPQTFVALLDASLAL